MDLIIIIGILAFLIIAAWYTGWIEFSRPRPLTFTLTVYLPQTNFRKNIRNWFVVHKWANRILFAVTSVDWSIYPSGDAYFKSAQPLPPILPFSLKRNKQEQI